MKKILLSLAIAILALGASLRAYTVKIINKSGVRIGLEAARIDKLRATKDSFQSSQPASTKSVTPSPKDPPMLAIVSDGGTIRSTMGFRASIQLDLWAKGMLFDSRESLILTLPKKEPVVITITDKSLNYTVSGASVTTDVTPLKDQ